MVEKSGDAVSRSKYRELAAALRRDVLTGLAFHEAIPTERELQKTYGVSRATVRRASWWMRACCTWFTAREPMWPIRN